MLSITGNIVFNFSFLCFFWQRQYDVIEESRRITDEIRREALQLSASINESLEESPERLSKKEDKTNPEKTSKAGLWVNKYAPTRYTHLLSDEVGTVVN